MQPFPHTQVNAIEREMSDMRDEISKLQMKLNAAQSCLNALYQKRQDIITEAREGDLYERMFGEDSAFMDDNFGG